MPSNFFEAELNRSSVLKDNILDKSDRKNLASFSMKTYIFGSC